MEGAGRGNDKRMPRKLKVKLYTTVLRPEQLYGLEPCALTRKEEMILETSEMRMLRRIIGVSLRDKKRNDEIRKELEVCIITATARENRLRWFGHLHRVEYRKPAKNIMSIEVNGKRGREDQERDGRITSREACRNRT